MNMNCTEINTRLDEYLDGDLTALETQLVEEHMAGCNDCQNSLGEIRALRRALNKLPVAEPDEAFEKRVFQEVRRQHADSAKHKFTAGFITAMAASLALWFASTVFIQQVPVDQPQVVMVALNDAHTVRLMFDAPKSIDQVTMSIGLPEHIELDGYPGRKELVWQARLKKGQNILALPLKVVAMGEGELVAYLSYGNSSKKFRVVLKTADNGVTNYEVQSLESV